MSLRRDFTKYLGGAAVGGIVGFYVGIKDLLGIRSTDSAPTPQQEPTPEPDTGDESGSDEEPESGRTSEILIADDFESDHEMEIYHMRTNRSDSYNWGTERGDTPDDGSYYGFINEGAVGSNTEAIATSNETIRWDQSYRFEFLIRCSDYDRSKRNNSVDLTWRGSMENVGTEITESTIKLDTFGTDSSGQRREFGFGGNGVTESDSIDIQWQESTWYNIQGYVNEETGNAEAKIWQSTEPEPDDYQISASVETGVTDQLPYGILIDGINDGQVTFEAAYIRWITR